MIYGGLIMSFLFVVQNMGGILSTQYCCCPLGGSLSSSVQCWQFRSAKDRTQMNGSGGCSHTNESHFHTPFFFREKWDMISGLTGGRVQTQPCEEFKRAAQSLRYLVEMWGWCWLRIRDYGINVLSSRDAEMFHSPAPLEKASACCWRNVIKKYTFDIIQCSWKTQELKTLIHSTLTESKDEDCDNGEEENGCQPAKVPHSQRVLAV